MNQEKNPMNMNGQELLQWAMKYVDSVQFQLWYKDYVQSTTFKKIRNKYQQIENELTRFSGICDGSGRNNYIAFREYVIPKIISDQEKKRRDVRARYNDFSNPTNYEDLPISIFYVWYFAHLYNESINMYEQNREWLDAATEGVSIQYTEQQEKTEQEWAGLWLKIKLLLSLFKNDEIHIPYLRSLAESLEMQNREYIDDDLDDLSTCQGVKIRFFSSLKEEKKLETYKLLGMLIPYKKELDSGEYDYFEAMVRLRDGDYEGALRYADKLQPGDVDYGAIVAMKLECLAQLGDIDAFIECLKNALDPSYKYTFTTAFLRLWIARLLLHASDMDFEAWTADTEAVNTLKVACCSYANGNKEDPINVVECYRLTCKILEELFAAIEQDACVAELSDGFTSNFHVSVRKRRLVVALELLDVFTKEKLSVLETYLEMPYAVEYDEMKKTLSDSIINSFLSNKRLDPVTDSRLICSVFMFIYNLGYIERFVEYVKTNVDYFSNSELHKVNADVLDVLHLAYIEARVHDIPCEELMAVVEGKFDDNEDKDTVKITKIKSMLSPMGKKAYESALWQYEKSLQEDYGWKDAGMLSLAFYRIIELEINEQIIKPLARRLTTEELDNRFNARSSNSGYYRSWNTVKENLKKHITQPDQAENLMLGELDVLFRNLTNPRYSGADDLAIYINNALQQVCDYGRADIPSLVSSDNRKKYRNPPAHTKYLPYSVARECKGFVEDALLKLFASLVSQ